MEKEKTEKSGQSSDFPDLDKGWAWVVLVASFGSFMLLGGTMYAVGIIHIALLERYGEDVSKTAWAGALHSALMSVGAPISTALIDRFSCRVAMVTSGCLFAIGYLATAFSPSIEVSILTCGLIAGCGGGAGYTASIVVVGFNFRHRRNLAMGFALSGIGAGMLVLAPVFEAARDFYGNSGFFIALAGLTIHMTVFGALCFPSKLEGYTQKARKTDIQKKASSGRSNLYSVFCRYLNVAIKRPVLCLCFCMFNYGLGTFLVLLHLPNYAIHKGSTPIQGSLLISVCGTMGVVGRILTGIAASFEKIDDIFIYGGSIGVVSLATFLFPLFSHSFAGQIFYAAVLGLFFGSCYVLTGSVNIKYVGVKSMAAAIGLEFFFCGIGALVGPVLAGWLVDHGGTYEHSFIVAGFFLLVATVLGIATVFVSSPEENHLKPPGKETVILPPNSRNGSCTFKKEDIKLNETDESEDPSKQLQMIEFESDTNRNTKLIDTAVNFYREITPEIVESHLGDAHESNRLLDDNCGSYRHTDFRNS